MSKLLSKFIRVAVEGKTTDGREISRQQIEEMAASYEPKRFGARIWPEHFRGLVPGGVFDALGDVTATKTEEIKDGELKGKLALYAQLSPLPALLKMNEAKQKVYTSIEMMSNFAQSGKAYLVGLAVTDSPASQGTEMMAFSEGVDVFTSSSLEFSLEMEEPKDNTPSLFDRVKETLSRKNKSDDKRFNDSDESILAIAESQQESLSSITSMQGELKSTTDNLSALSETIDKLQEDFTGLKDVLEKNPNNNHHSRQPASGGSGAEQIATDC